MNPAPWRLTGNENPRIAAGLQDRPRAVPQRFGANSALMDFFEEVGQGGHGRAKEEGFVPV